MKGGWREISWDEAYSEIVDRFADIRDKWGAEAIVIGFGAGSYSVLDCKGSPGLLCDPAMGPASLRTLLCNVRKAN